MKLLTRRRPGTIPFGFERLATLQTIAIELRGVTISRPRGVFYFHSFEEAQAWWLSTLTARPVVPPPSMTSPSSAKPSTTPKPATS
ncbi:MAG: hypothetical protein ACT4OO_04475 [Nitrospiraceae bacterium]